MADVRVAAERHTRFAGAGTQLFRERDAAAEMYVLRAGRVRLTRRVRGQERLLDEVGPGEFLGEMALLLRRPHSATATVVEDATLLALDRATFEEMIGSSAPIAVRLLGKLAARLDLANAQVDALLLPDHTHRVVQLVASLARITGRPDADGGVALDLPAAELGERAGISDEELAPALDRLSRSRLLVPLAGRGFRVPDAQRLAEFLAFLDGRTRARPPTRP
jgi:CRP-like cAMP-binding protein